MSRGPDGQILSAICATCAGGGVVDEYHGQGNTETLGCPDCNHPDEPAAVGVVWRFHLARSGDGWEVREAGSDRPCVGWYRSVPLARHALHHAERTHALALVLDAEAAVMVAVVEWRASRITPNDLAQLVDDLTDARRLNALVTAER